MSIAESRFFFAEREGRLPSRSLLLSRCSSQQLVRLAALRYVQGTLLLRSYRVRGSAAKTVAPPPLSPSSHFSPVSLTYNGKRYVSVPSH